MVTSVDSSLFHVAARELGSAMQWWTIANANGIIDPDLSAFTVPVPLVIPDPSPALTSGVSGLDS